MGTLASGAEAWLTLNGKPLSFRRSDENLDANALEYGNNVLKVNLSAPDDIEIRIDEEPLETEIYGRWTWRPRGFAGLYQIQVRAPGCPVHTAQVRVLPSKLSYERYRQMLVDIAHVAEDLAYQIRSPAGEKAAIGPAASRSSAIREYKLVRTLMREMEQTMAAIRRSPHRDLAEARYPVLLHQAGHFGGEVEPVPGPLVLLPESMQTVLGLQTLPQNWMAIEHQPSYDVFENQLLKNFLWRQLLPRIYSIQDRAESESKRRQQQRTMKIHQGWEDDESEKIQDLEKVQKECQVMANRCVAWGSEAFLQTVSPLTLGNRPSQVLQKNPHYSRFYRVYLRFQQELKLSLDADRYLTTIAMRKMSELYETWAVFKMTDFLITLMSDAGYQILSSNGFFEVKEDQFHLDVDRNAIIELGRGGTKVRIRYEPIYLHADRVRFGLVSMRPPQLTPDLVLEVWEDGQVRQALVFDAKYRTNEERGIQTYVSEDLEKMDLYLNGIRWKTLNPRQKPQKVVRSAYILYPGDVLEHDKDDAEVGALPFVPNLDRPRRVATAMVQLLRHAGIL